MDSEEYELVRELYHQLAGCSAEEIRRKLAASTISEAVRAELESLLGHGQRLAAFAEDQLGAVGRQVARGSSGGASVPASREAVPSQIAGFRIEDVLGRGGMGVVYRAVQEKPRREVAVKVLQAFALPSTRRRFEYEAEVLARLDHPFIAKVIEAGVDEALGNLPYIVMELVRGTDIVSHCDEQGLALVPRLELFQRVCEGIEHAHQHGVVHRDVKPANVLVSADGRPRILDFGIARPVRASEETTPGQTEAGSVVGSLAWMSPEQARGELDVLDVRSDVYSLGVVLYRLLTGAMPYEVGGLPPWEAARRICEDEPKRLGHQRHELRGDLEAIVSRALEKDPADRYPGAGALARDIQRHLDLQPVEARPWSASYQLRKFARRHRVLVGAAVALFVAIVTGLITGLVLWRQAEKARGVADQETRRARELLVEAQAARSLASQEAERAREEARTAEGVVQLFTGMFDEVQTYRVAGDEVTVKEVLDGAAPRITAELERDLAIRARILGSIGQVYQKLGLFDEAQPLLTQAVADLRADPRADPYYLLSAVYYLGLLYAERGFMEQAEPLFEESARGLRSLQPHTWFTLQVLADQADMFVDSGRYDEAEALLVETLDLARTHLGEERAERSALYKIMASLTVLYMNQQRFDEAKSLAVATLEGRRELLGAGHPRTLAVANSLAQLHMELRDFEAAEPLSAEVMEGMALALGERHPYTLTVTRNHANLYLRMGRSTQAEPLLVETIEAMREVLGPGHRDTLSTWLVLADLQHGQGRTDEAKQLLESLLSDCRESLGDGHPNTIDTMRELAELNYDLGAAADGERLYFEALEVSLRELGPASPSTVAVLQHLTDHLLAQSRFGEARGILDDVIARAQEEGKADTPSVLSLHVRRAVVEARAGDPALGAQLLSPTIEAIQRVFGDDHERTHAALESLSRMQREAEANARD